MTTNKPAKIHKRALGFAFGESATFGPACSILKASKFSSNWPEVTCKLCMKIKEADDVASKKRMSKEDGY